ncbi:MAG TPA: VOC family protein [Gammaproteobacteria bacterium]|jgi:catechol 2,3-dioxygenase-like lactoylglutathione lyase family enzyme|nr:VOC family protein [Gammaproteobacteria bacterium]
MDTLITDLVERFDRGTLSRRHLIQGLAALAAAGSALPAAAQTAPFKSSRIDHISVQTTNLARSIEFYTRVFGLKVLNEDKENKIARMGVTKIIVSLHEKPPVGIVDHFAIAIDDFDRNKVTAELAKLGLKAEENLDYGFFVRDPEGVPVQIVKS